MTEKTSMPDFVRRFVGGLLVIWSIGSVCIVALF